MGFGVGDRVKVASMPGIAYTVIGDETQPDEDTVWTGLEVYTGRKLVRAVGDDRVIGVDDSELSPLARDDYCGQCGQIGCGHDGLDR